MANWEIKQGDCIEVMRGMEPESAHCVVTSPPSDESWTLGSRVIHGANVEKHLLAFGYDHKGKASSTGAVVVALATMFRDVLAFPEIEEECCLRSFDSQIRHEAISHICGNQIRRLPDKQWPSVASRRLLHAAFVVGTLPGGGSDSFCAHIVTTKRTRGEIRYGGSGGDRLPPLMSQPEKEERVNAPEDIQVKQVKSLR